MEFEPEDGEQMFEFEQQLREAFERRPAPPSLKGKIIAARSRQNTDHLHARAALLQRLAACIVLTAALAGGFAWRHHQEQQRGEEARRQVLTALRITNQALDRMKTQLDEHDQDKDR